MMLRPFSFSKASFALGFILGLRSMQAAEPTPTPLGIVIQQAFAASAQQYQWLLTHQPLAGKFPRSFEHD
ncbi:MAG: hypothetical protein EBT62_08495, partial [Opitutaceae bacterium]|nr:hypothetical protein [Opitutaceae bacterium]